MSARTKLIIAIIIIVCSAGFIVYSNIYSSPFVFDDVRVIEENQSIRKFAVFDWSSLLRSRGIVDVTFALNYYAGRQNPFGYHLFNVLLHVLNGVIVFFLALKIYTLIVTRKSCISVKGPLWIQKIVSGPGMVLIIMAGLSALIFVVHPIQTQAVTYTVQRYASMAALFYMSSLLFFIQGRALQKNFMIQSDRTEPINDAASDTQRKKKRRKDGRVTVITSTIASMNSRADGAVSRSFLVSFYFILSILSAVLALLSKQNAASLPLMLAMAEFVFFDRNLKSWIRKIPIGIVIAVVWLLLNLTILGIPVYRVFIPSSDSLSMSEVLDDVDISLRETPNVTRWRYLLTQFNVIVVYLRLLIFPVGQNLDYFYPFKEGFFDGYTPLAFLALLSIAGIGIYYIRKRPVVAFGIFWFFIALSVESSIIPIRDALFEHRLYLPLFGFSLIAGYLLLSIFRDNIMIACVIALAVIASFGIATIARNNVWRSEVALWSDTVRKAPHNMFAKVYLASALSNVGRYDEAINLYNEALRRNPRHLLSLFSLGIAYEGKGDLQKAMEYYEKVHRQDPNYVKNLYNMAVIYHRTGRWKEAAEFYSKALERSPDDVKILTNYAVLLYQNKNFDDAVKHLRKAEFLEPDETMIQENLGSSYLAKGDFEQAVFHYNRAVKLDPRNGHIRFMLAFVYGAVDKTNEAIDQYREAMRLDPSKTIEASYRIAGICARKGKQEEALLWLRKAIAVGFQQWDRLKNDRQFEAIRNTVEYKNFIAGR